MALELGGDCLADRAENAPWGPKSKRPPRASLTAELTAACQAWGNPSVRRGGRRFACGFPASRLQDSANLRASELDELIASLTDLRQTHWQTRVDNCSPNDHLPRSGRPLRFLFPDRVVATLLHLRLDPTTRDLAQLYGTSPATIRRVLRETRPLLEEHGHVVTPPTTSPLLPIHMPRYEPAATPQSNTKETR